MTAAYRGLFRAVSAAMGLWRVTTRHAGTVARALHLRTRFALPRLSTCAQGKKRQANVNDKLGFLVRFWELKARHSALGEPLAASERLELLSLMQLVIGDFKMPAPGTCAQPSNALPAQLIGEGTILPIEVRHVCAAGLLVASVKWITPAERVVVHTADAVSGVEYTLPCSVAWVYDGTPCIMALAVDGIPTRSEFAVMPQPRVANMLSMGRQVRLVG